MINLIRGEVYKIRKSRGIRLTILLSIITIIFTCLFLNITFEKKPESIKYFSGINALQQCLGQVLGANCLFALLAATFITKDFHNEYINKSFSYGYDRRKIILSKLIVYIGATFILGFICAIFFINWLLYFTNTSIIINYKSLILIFRIIIFSGICTAATVSLNFMVAVVCNNILVTLLCPIALMVISWLAEICGDNVSRFLPFRSIWLIIGENLNIEDIIVTIISSIIMFSLCIGISLMYVNKKDFK